MLSPRADILLLVRRPQYYSETFTAHIRNELSMARIYFEDITEGEQLELGSVTIDREEMIAFAERYDPQRIHTDPAFASQSMFGGLIASGWFTVGICMRLFVDEFLSDAAGMGAFGAELAWPSPVRANDTLDVQYQAVETRKSESKSDRGYVENEIIAENQHGDTVLEWTGTGIFRTRTGDS